MGTRPDGAWGPESSEGMIRSDPFASQYLNRRPIIDIFSVPPFQVDESGGGTGELEIFGTGNAEAVEVNSSGIPGLYMANTNALNILWTIPNDIDLAGDLQFRALFSNSEAASASKTVNYTLSYLSLLASTTAVAAPTTTTGVTNGDAVAVAAANVLQATNWATLAGSTLVDVGFTPGKDQMIVKMTCALSTAADASLFKVQARYYRRQIG